MGPYLGPVGPFELCWRVVFLLRFHPVRQHLNLRAERRGSAREPRGHWRSSGSHGRWRRPESTTHTRRGRRRRRPAAGEGWRRWGWRPSAAWGGGRWRRYTPGWWRRRGRGCTGTPRATHKGGRDCSTKSLRNLQQIIRKIIDSNIPIKLLFAKTTSIEKSFFDLKLHSHCAFFLIATAFLKWVAWESMEMFILCIFLRCFMIAFSQSDKKCTMWTSL